MPQTFGVLPKDRLENHWALTRGVRVFKLTSITATKWVRSWPGAPYFRSCTTFKLLLENRYNTLASMYGHELWIVLFHRSIFLKKCFFVSACGFYLKKKITVCLSCHLNAAWSSTWSHHLYNLTAKHCIISVLLMSQSMQAVSARSRFAFALSVWTTTLARHLSVTRTTEKSIFISSIVCDIRFPLWMDLFLTGAKWSVSHIWQVDLGQ